MKAIGDTLTFIWPLTDSSGASLTGKAASITTVVARRIAPDGAVSTITPSSWSEIGSTGTYKATVVAGAVGDHYVQARYSESGQPVQNRAATIEVVTQAQSDPASSIATQGLVLVQSGALVADAGALTIRRGDTTTWTIPLDTDITGYTLWFSVKTGRPSSPNADLDDSSALINAYWIDGGASDVRNTAGATIGTIEVDDPTEGTVVITLTPEYTTTLTGATGYSWEIQLENPDGGITTWTAGTLNVTLDLIRRTSIP